MAQDDDTPSSQNQPSSPQTPEVSTPKPPSSQSQEAATVVLNTPQTPEVTPTPTTSQTPETTTAVPKSSRLKQAVELASNKIDLTKEQATRAREEFSKNAGRAKEQISEGAERAAKFAGEKYEEFKESRAGKVAAFLTGKFFTRSTAIVTTSILLAGAVSAAAGPAAIVPLSLALAGAGIGIVKDVIDVRNNRLLKKENDMLAKFVDSRLKEKEVFVEVNQVLGKDRDLSEILKDKLTSPKAKEQQENKTLSDKTSKVAEATGKVAFGFNIVKDIVTYGLKFDVKNVALSVINGLALLVTGAERRVAVNETKNTLENQIKVLKENDLTPGYKDATDLKKSLREQRIQQMALEKLSLELHEWKKIPDALPLTDEQIQKRFDAHKADIEKKEKAVSERTWTKEIKSFFKDIGRSFNPSSQYYEQSTVKFNVVVLETDAASGKQSHKLEEKFTTKDLKEYKTKQLHQEEALSKTQEQLIEVAKTGQGPHVVFNQETRQATVHNEKLTEARDATKATIEAAQQAVNEAKANQTTAENSLTARMEAVAKREAEVAAREATQKAVNEAKPAREEPGPIPKEKAQPKTEVEFAEKRARLEAKMAKLDLAQAQTLGQTMVQSGATVDKSTLPTTRTAVGKGQGQDQNVRGG